MKKKYLKPDVDIVEELSKKLFIANKELKQEKQLKEDMICNISHDLRAPLTAIRSSIDYLNSSYDIISKEELCNTLSILDSRTSILETLVNDLFYLISINSSANNFHLEKIDLTPVIEEYYYTLLSDAAFDNRHLTLMCDSDKVLLANVDIARFLRVLDNLTTNAKKYSNDGDSITIGISEDTSLDNIIVFVRDTGIGIDEKNLNKIFERSYTVSSSRTPTLSGSGLGLAIVKEIIQKHNGKVYCESKLNEGSTFYVILPKA